MVKIVSVEPEVIKGADHIVVTLSDGSQIMNNWKRGFSERGKAAKALIGKEVEWDTWCPKNFPKSEWFKNIWEVK